MVYSEKWIFIRFNPDPIGKSKKKIDKEVERIKKENTELVEIIKLF